MPVPAVCTTAPVAATLDQIREQIPERFEVRGVSAATTECRSDLVRPNSAPTESNRLQSRSPR